MRQYYIVRHGAVGICSEWAEQDSEDCGLSEEGQRITREVARALHHMGCEPEKIYSSPRRRALDTGQIFRAELAHSVELESSKVLAPGSRPKILMSWLRGLQVDRVMLIGHGPDMAMVTSELLSNGLPVGLTFEPSGACCVSSSGPPHNSLGQLEWFLQPQQLHRLTESREVANNAR